MKSTWKEFALNFVPLFGFFTALFIILSMHTSVLCLFAIITSVILVCVYFFASVRWFRKNVLFQNVSQPLTIKRILVALTCIVAIILTKHTYLENFADIIFNIFKEDTDEYSHFIKPFNSSCSSPNMSLHKDSDTAQQWNIVRKYPETFVCVIWTFSALGIIQLFLECCFREGKVGIREFIFGPDIDEILENKPSQPQYDVVSDEHKEKPNQESQKPQKSLEETTPFMEPTENVSEVCSI